MDGRASLSLSLCAGGWLAGALLCVCEGERDGIGAQGRNREAYVWFLSWCASCVGVLNVIAMMITLRTECSFSLSVWGGHRAHDRHTPDHTKEERQAAAGGGSRG